MDLLERIRKRETRAIARALTLVENGDDAFLSALDAAYADLPTPERIGITGPPGAGKSTLTSALIGALREQGKRVGVVAVDPSSPFSGGALLGDRLRMTEHVLDAEVFVRSMAARGRFGGLAIGSEDACEVLALAAFDPVIVETVGVGQSEVDIASLADTTVVVLTPSAGDSVQALKAGIMEIADVVVINKSDREGAERLEEDIREALELRPHPPEGQAFHQPPIVHTVATEGTGVKKLAEAIAQHRQFLTGNALLDGVRQKRAESRLTDLAGAAMLRALKTGKRAKALFEGLREQVSAGQMSPRAAVKQLIHELDL
jgi:LAO/AO transport system kinase